MSRFTLTGFADEIDQNLEVQMQVLKELGIKHIEMRGVNGKNLCDHSLEEVRVIKETLDQNGFALSAIGSPIGKIKITDDFKPHLDKFMHVLDIAEIMKVKYIRLFSFFIPAGSDYSIYRDEVFFRMKELINAAEGRNVILLHENEKEIYGDNAERCLDILKTLNCDYLRATFDPANFIQCNEEVYPNAFNLLKPYIEYIHIKDARYSDGIVVPAGEGEGKIHEILKELIQNDFNGFLSLEPHLCDFIGFSQLEDSNEHKAPATEGISLFIKAANKLKIILKDLGVDYYE